MNNYKLLSLVIALFSMQAIALGQSPTWTWANFPSSDFSSNSKTLVVDEQGNTYLTGSYAGGDLTVDMTTISPAILTPAFIAKFNPEGELVWILPLGNEGTNQMSALALGIDNEGELLFAGQFLSFGGVDLAVGDLVLDASLGPAQAFLLKVSNDGEPLWIETLHNELAPSPYIIVNSISFDQSNDFVIAGGYQVSMKLGDLILDSSGSYDVFLAKGDANGDFVWAQNIGGQDQDKPADVAFDSDNNIFVSGSWAGDTLHIGDQILVNDAALVGDNFDRWIAKFDTMGDLNWAVREAGGETEWGAELAATSEGGVVTHSKLFGEVNIEGNTISAGGTMTSKYGPDGAFQSAEKITECDFLIPFEFIYEEDKELTLTTDGSDNFYFGVSYSSAEITIGAETLSNAGTDIGSADFALFKMGLDGTVEWSESYGGMDNDEITDMVISPDGSGTIVGFSSSIEMGLGDLDLSYDGLSQNFFVAEFESATAIPALDLQIGLSIYPNPCTNELAIQLDHGSNEPLTYTIYNLAGQTVWQSGFLSQAYSSLNTEKLDRGMYLLKVESADNVWKSTFLKQ
jgi:hypothetical protein